MNHSSLIRTLAALATVALTACSLAACTNKVEPEGACFGPGEACGDAICSQSGFCDSATNKCEQRRLGGNLCTSNHECTSNLCTNGKCASEPPPCTEE